jgi:chromosome segregation ATPase
VLVVVAASVIGGCWLVQALAQQERPRDQARQPGDRRARMEEFRRRAQERMREQLGATEEEWKVLQPRIEKVQQLQRQARGGFRGVGARTGRRAQRPGEAQRPEGAPVREQSEVEKKTEALRNLLDDKASGAPAIKAALAALRTARQKAQQELAAARKELRSIVSVRQEAQLVLMGMLE